MFIWVRRSSGSLFLVRRNALFVERLGKLRTAFETILNRRWSSDQPVDRFIFIAGHLSVDDFMEIFTMAGNGEGYGAEKLLRSMFERVVTLKYPYAHPDEFEEYMNYYWIHQHKRVNAIERC